MKYLSKIINCFKGNAVFFISLIAYLNSYVKNDIYFQTYIYITLGILLLIEAFYVVNLNWKAEKKIFFSFNSSMFFVDSLFLFDVFKH